ncbi:MAG: hypothetical protein WCF36_01965 [Candidatus Nanopelagicales bacterium]
MTRIATGAYASTDGLVAEEVHQLRVEAVLNRLQNVVASHISAGILWGLPFPSAQLQSAHVSPTPMRRGRPKSGPGYRMHHVQCLTNGADRRAGYRPPILS